MICHLVMHCSVLIEVIWGDHVYDDYLIFQDQFIASLHQEVDGDVHDLLQEFLDDALEIVSRGTYCATFDQSCLDDPEMQELYDGCIQLVVQVQDQAQGQAQGHD